MLGFIPKSQKGGFLRFWFAQLSSQFGDRINQMSLVGLIAARSGSAFDMAILFSASIIPVFIVGPVAGVYVDRWDRRTTLFVCDFIRSLLIATIPFIFIFWKTIIPIYVIVFISFSLSRFYVLAKMSFVPDLVEQKDLHSANSWTTVSGMIAFVIGARVGGIIVEFLGASGGFLVDAFTFLLSGLLILSIPKGTIRFSLSRQQWINRSRDMISTFHKSVSGEIKEGIRYIISNHEIRFIMVIMTILFMAVGAIYVVIIVFIQEAFHSVTRDLGILAVRLGIGLFLGSIVYGRWGKHFSPFRTIFISLMAGGAMMAVFAFFVQTTQNRTGAEVLALILGFVIGPMVIAANTVVHFVCTNEMRGKVFSALEIVMHFGFLIAMLISSLLSEVIPRFWILSGVGIIFLMVGFVGLLKFKDVDVTSKNKSVPLTT